MIFIPKNGDAQLLPIRIRSPNSDAEVATVGTYIDMDFFRPAIIGAELKKRLVPLQTIDEEVCFQDDHPMLKEVFGFSLGKEIFSVGEIQLGTADGWRSIEAVVSEAEPETIFFRSFFDFFPQARSQLLSVNTKSMLIGQKFADIHATPDDRIIRSGPRDYSLFTSTLDVAEREISRIEGNADRAQAAALIIAIRALSESPTPPWEIVKRLLAILGGIASLATIAQLLLEYLRA